MNEKNFYDINNNIDTREYYLHKTVYASR